MGAGRGAVPSARGWVTKCHSRQSAAPCMVPGKGARRRGSSRTGHARCREGAHTFLRSASPRAPRLQPAPAWQATGQSAHPRIALTIPSLYIKITLASSLFADRRGRGAGVLRHARQRRAAQPGVIDTARYCIVRQVLCSRVLCSRHCAIIARFSFVSQCFVLRQKKGATAACYLAATRG